MATKTPAQVAQEFLLALSGLKPDVDISLTDSDWYIKAQALGGAMAGIYGDQNLLANDPFPQAARVSALQQHLQTYFTAPNNQFLSAQPATGFMAVTGVIGSVISVGMQASYPPNGNVYTSVSGLTMSATAALVPMTSIAQGQNQNLLSGATLIITSPPAGVNATASASGNFSLGRDMETAAEAAARILAFIQTPPAGGTVADYVRWAEQASPLVTGATILRFPSGFGTVGVIITAGTTNIPAAIDQGVPVIISPTQDLINVVQSYIDTVNPITDCATVYPPTLFPVNVTVSCWFAQGDATTILPNQPFTTGGAIFTQGQLVANEIMKAIYATPTGGRQIEGQGYLIKSDLEEQVDSALSNEPNQTGVHAVLNDRYIGNLSATGPNLSLSGLQQPVPGTITVVAL